MTNDPFEHGINAARKKAENELEKTQKTNQLRTEKNNEIYDLLEQRFSGYISKEGSVFSVKKDRWHVVVKSRNHGFKVSSYPQGYQVEIEWRSSSTNYYNTIRNEYPKTKEMLLQLAGEFFWEYVDPNKERRNVNAQTDNQVQKPAYNISSALLKLQWLVFGAILIYLLLR